MFKSREYTNKLLDMIEDGLLDKDKVITALVSYMSESDVKDMMEYNEFIEVEEDEEDELFIDYNGTGGKW